MAKRTKVVAAPAWASVVFDAGATIGGTEGKVAAAVAALIDAGVGEDGLPEVEGQYMLGYLSVQVPEVAAWIRLDKKAFKVLPGDAKDRTTEKGMAQHARNNAGKARGKFIDRVKEGLGISPAGENAGAAEDETGTEGEADIATRIDAARKAYAKAVERAETQIKKARQTLADLGAPVIAEAMITAGFLCFRGPMGGEPDKAE